jgi:signal transduction histidine kinase
MPDRRRPIRRQIFVPFAALLACAVGGVALTASVAAARRSDAGRIERLQNVLATLGDASFPYSESVLQKMRGLSGAHFVAVAASGAPVTTMAGIDAGALAGVEPVDLGTLKRLSDFSTVRIGEQEFFAGAIRTHSGTGPLVLYILSPVESWREARWSAAWPPLVIGAVTVVLTALLSGWLAHRIAGRMGRVRALFVDLAAGEHPHIDPQPPVDELHDLMLAANELSDRLAALQQDIRHTERARLLGQVAGGLAHHIRNTATGARLALQLHRRRCTATNGDESLDVAMRQLELTEQHLQGLLSLSPARRSGRPGRLSSVMSDVSRILDPICRHSRVTLHGPDPLRESDCELDDADEMRAALLNLGWNAVEAAGVGGRVRIDVRTDVESVIIDVADSGPGPAPEVAPRMFEPFVSSKPEGVGLGLALVRRAAEAQGGDVYWRRDGEETVFSVRLPICLNSTSGRGRTADKPREPHNGSRPQSAPSLECTALAGGVLPGAPHVTSAP